MQMIGEAFQQALKGFAWGISVAYMTYAVVRLFWDIHYNGTTQALLFAAGLLPATIVFWVSLTREVIHSQTSEECAPQQESTPRK
jgi:hypothetical protein